MRGLALLAALGLAAAAPAPTHAEPARLTPAARLFPFLDIYDALPAAERSRFALRYRFLSKDGRPDPGLRMTLVDGATETPLPLAADGTAERAPSAAELGRKAQVRVASPTPGHRVEFEMEALVRPAAEIAAADLAASAAQLATAIHGHAGPLGLLAPRFTRVVFRGAQGGVLVGADGRETPLAAPHRWPAVDVEALRAARAVRFAQPPTRILLEPPDK